MGVSFTGGENGALYSLLEGSTSDVFLKTDRKGFIVHATPAAQCLGLALEQLLIGPHLGDMIQPAQREMVLSAHRAALMGFDLEDWIEFRAAAGAQRGRWFEVRLRCLRDESNRIAGTLGMVRNIEERKMLEERLFAAEMTCPLTGLTNRKAFVAMLDHLIVERIPGSLAIFSIDYLKAINLRHGQSVGNEVLVAFSDLLCATMRSRDIVSRFGGQSLAVLFPETSIEQAEAVCRTMTETLAELGAAAPGVIPVTASIGIGSILPSLDDTIRRAELALVHARARGPNCQESLRGGDVRPFNRAA